MIRTMLQILIADAAADLEDFRSGRANGAPNWRAKQQERPNNVLEHDSEDAAARYGALGDTGEYPRIGLLHLEPDGERLVAYLERRTPWDS